MFVVCSLTLLALAFVVGWYVFWWYFLRMMHRSGHLLYEVEDLAMCWFLSPVMFPFYLADYLFSKKLPDFKEIGQRIAGKKEK